MDEMVFDTLEPVRVPVTIAGKRYVLCEADEAAAARFEDAKLRGAKFDRDGGVMEHGNLNEARAVLLAGCLQEVYEHRDNGQVTEKTRPVSLAWIKGLLSRVSGPLYDRAVEISGLNVQATPEFLEKQIARLQEQLEAARNGRGSPKN